MSLSEGHLVDALTQIERNEIRISWLEAENDQLRTDLREATKLLRHHESIISEGIAEWTRVTALMQQVKVWLGISGP